MLWHGSHSFLKLHSLNTSGLQLQSLSLQWDCFCPAASMGKGFVGAGVIGACVLKQTPEKEQILLPSATADPSSKSPGSSSGNFTQRASIVLVLVRPSCFPVVLDFGASQHLRPWPFLHAQPAAVTVTAACPLPQPICQSAAKGSRAGSGSLSASGLWDELQRDTWSTS